MRFETCTEAAKTATNDIRKTALQSGHVAGMPAMRILALVLAFLSFAAPARAEETWTPNRPIKLIVTYAPGGSADVLARILQAPMSQTLGVPVVVENRGGGAGNIGSETIARAEPDGYTIGIGAVSTHAINPTLFGANLPFRVPQDFTAISQILSQPNLLLVNPGVPAKTPAEFIAWLKANPGMPFGTAGVGSSPHLTGEMINLRFGVTMTHVPYKSGGQALDDLMGGHVKVVVDNIATAAPLAKNGQARAIAVSTLKRAAILPDTPTFDESGAPGFDLSSWQGLFGPAGLPDPVVQRLHAAVVAALADPAVRAHLIEFGAEPVGSSPAEFLTFINHELKKWGDLVKASGATVD
jgi:tripartite-type tricarboxylate transporter receptor subunit TctC